MLLIRVRDFCEARGVRWGGRIAKPQPLADHRRENTDSRVHQVHGPRVDRCKKKG